MRALALMLALVAGAGIAGAAPPSTPGLQLYQAGERAFHQQHWEEARRSFAAAYELDRKPELLYDVALATWRLAREDETLASLQAARAAYQRYLDEATAGRRRKAAEEALAQIDAQLPKPKAPSKPPVSDEDDDPARPLDPYAGVHKLPPIPKPVIVAEPAKPKAQLPPANPNLHQGMAAVDEAQRSPEELHKLSKPETSRPETPKPPTPAKPVQTTPLPKGIVEIGRDSEVPPRGPHDAHAPQAIVATHTKPKERKRAWVTPVVVVGVLCAAGLAIGLGVGLSEHSSSDSLGSIKY